MANASLANAVIACSLVAGLLPAPAHSQPVQDRPPPLIEAYPADRAVVGGQYHCSPSDVVTVEIRNDNGHISLARLDGFGRRIAAADREMVNHWLAALDWLTSYEVDCSSRSIIMTINGKRRGADSRASLSVWWSALGVRNYDPSTWPHPPGAH
jgi:hypothetical protein